MAGSTGSDPVLPMVQWTIQMRNMKGLPSNERWVTGDCIGLSSLLLLLLLMMICLWRESEGSGSYLVHKQSFGSFGRAS